MLGFDRSGKVAGIDIGSKTIKLAELTEKKNGIELSHIAVAPMPAEAVVDGVIVNPAIVGDTIARMADSCNVEAVRAVGAVSGPSVLTRQLRLPRMSEAQLRRSIPWEAKRYISSPIEDCIVEFEILQDVPGDSEITVLLVVAPKTAVDGQVESIERAGFDAVAIDIGPFAVVRSVIETAPDLEYRKLSLALVDIGAHYTDFNIVTQGNLVFTRSIPLGGETITQGIHSTLNLDVAEAEEFKYHLNALKMIPANGKVGNPVINSIQTTLDELVREIRRTINYYQSLFAEGSEEGVIQGLLLSGGTSRMQNIDKYLERQLQIPVQTADVFTGRYLNIPDQLAGYLDNDSVSMSAAIGLALREMKMYPRSNTTLQQKALSDRR